MIYRLSPSAEPRRPRIDLELQALSDSDWAALNDPAPKGAERLSCTHIDFFVPNRDAINWDCFSFSAKSLFSQRAHDLLWPYARNHFLTIDVLLNSTPYSMWRDDNCLALDALDRSKSRIDYLPSDPKTFLRIHRYVFREELIEDPLIFQIPEKGGIFCTPSIRQMILDAKLRGFFFEDMSRDVLY